MVLGGAVLHSVDGIDINMGCPQRWAMQDGCGAALLGQVETVRQMARLVRATVPPSMPFSAKIRIVTVDGELGSPPPPRCMHLAVHPAAVL